MLCLIKLNSTTWPNDGGIIRPVKLLALEKPAVRSAFVRYDIDFSNSFRRYGYRGEKLEP